MTVTLTNILSPLTQSHQDPVNQTVVDPPTQCTATGPLDENPFCLTNEEIDELLKGLEGIGDGVLKGPEGSGVSAGHSIDTELDSVLNMCVEDYVV